MNWIERFENEDAKVSETFDLDTNFYLVVLFITVVLAVFSFAGVSDSNLPFTAAIPDYACTKLTGNWGEENTKFAENRGVRSEEKTAYQQSVF